MKFSELVKNDVHMQKLLSEDYSIGGRDDGCWVCYCCREFYSRQEHIASICRATALIAYIGVLVEKSDDGDLVELTKDIPSRGAICPVQPVTEERRHILVPYGYPDMINTNPKRVLRYFLEKTQKQSGT